MNLKSLPTTPGVYLLKRGRTVLYVGKALNVRERVKSHLQAKGLLSPKAAQMRGEVDNVDYIPVRSDFEALLLEINLIKKLTPPYNIKLRDDKDFLYLKITKEDFPGVLAVRKRDLEGSQYFLGPFPNAALVRKTIKNLRRIFPYCSERQKTGKPCFYYHLGLCSGACAGVVTQKDYQKMIKSLISFLEGKSDKLLLSWQKEMEKLASRKKFEEAARLRDRIQGATYLTQENKTFDYLKKPDLLDELLWEEGLELQKLLGVKTDIHRIECYDISHLQGSSMVGSMVVFFDGQPDKAEYRRFRIKRVGRVDDYASLQEVLRRRFHNDWALPDLLVIDGGKGQLNACLEVLDQLNITIPMISLAKREEEIYTQDGSRVRLERSNPALKLIQRLRDEAHRFAITYHRKLRSDALLKLNA